MCSFIVCQSLVRLRMQHSHTKLGLQYINLQVITMMRAGQNRRYSLQRIHIVTKLMNVAWLLHTYAQVPVQLLMKFCISQVRLPKNYSDIRERKITNQVSE